MGAQANGTGAAGLGTKWGRNLVHKMVCPACFEAFAPEGVLFVAGHPELIGDSVLGDREYRRFSPTQFTQDGRAIDPRGALTDQIACPNCHWQLPSDMLEVRTRFISIVGAPASGKSYFLAALVSKLRYLLPNAYLQFTDTDPERNSVVHEYETTLFRTTEKDRPTQIIKTQRDDPRLHVSAQLGGVQTRLARPLLFTLRPTPKHAHFLEREKSNLIVVLYDNAGEDFLPGAAEPISEATVRHVSNAHLVLFLFDPAQDDRLRPMCKSSDPQIMYGVRTTSDRPSGQYSQESIVNYLAHRVRKYRNLAQGQRINTPIIVVVSKFDMLNSLTDVSIDEEPYTAASAGLPVRMDLDMVEKASRKVREVLFRHCPDFVTAAENLSTTVRYIPVSGLGGSPTRYSYEDRNTGKREYYYGVCPKDVKPRWVTVPFVYCLCSQIEGKGLIDCTGSPNARKGGA